MIGNIIMNLDDIFPAPNSRQVAKLAASVFGHSLDLANITEGRAAKLHNNLKTQLAVYENKLGAKAFGNPAYTEMKLAFEAVSKHLTEKKKKPDANKNGIPDYAEDGKGPNDLVKGKKPKKGEVPPQFAKTKVKESFLREGDMENAELVLAAKSMVDKFDAIIQDVGEMLNEDLQPLSDKIRDELGSNIAESFKAQMTAALTATMESLNANRTTADSAARTLTGDTPAVDAMGGADEIGADELAMEPTVDQEDDFAASSAAMGGEEPVGRAKR